ncbi:MAG: single-stranded DNA-specific exonuclease [Candidatus Thermoplasmatota archaeon]|nr:single-stranded DNA-specific exonuclease [Candidatus Thermoplasmatota archaeon]
MQELEALKGRGLLIHHWDTDGICSARLLLPCLAELEVDTMTPALGNYFLTGEELEAGRGYDFVVIADMSLPEDNIRHLARSAKVLIFDHHLGRVIPGVFHHNPVIRGGNPDRHPSASWIVNEYLGQPVNLYALLGAVGDHEHRIRDNDLVYPQIEDFCQKHRLTFHHLMDMVHLLDANYKIGDRKAVERAPHQLLAMDGPRDILDHGEWNRSRKKLDREMERLLGQPVEQVGDTMLLKMNTPYNLISAVTRRLAWDSGRDTVVVNTGFFDREDQIYVRSTRGNLQSLIQRGKERGYRCGGKKEVLGAILPRAETGDFVAEILAFLNENHSGGKT